MDDLAVVEEVTDIGELVGSMVDLKRVLMIAGFGIDVVVGKFVLAVGGTVSPTNF